MTQNQQVPQIDGMEGFQPSKVKKKGYQPPKTSEQKKPTGTPPQKP